MATPEIRAMTPAQRGRLLSRAVGVKRRLEKRQRDGAITPEQRAELREARLTLAALEDLDIALRGTDLTRTQARARRAALRRQLGLTKKRRTKRKVINTAVNLTTEQRVQAVEELAEIDTALARDAAANPDHKPRSMPRAQPKRVTTVVSGGLPGLGRNKS